MINKENVNPRITSKNKYIDTTSTAVTKSPRKHKASSNKRKSDYNKTNYTNYNVNNQVKDIATLRPEQLQNFIHDVKSLSPRYIEITSQKN